MGQIQPSRPSLASNSSLVRGLRHGQRSPVASAWSPAAAQPTPSLFFCAKPSSGLAASLSPIQSRCLRGGMTKPERSSPIKKSTES
jgi:hypothetical protein